MFSKKIVVLLLVFACVCATTLEASEGGLVQLTDRRLVKLKDLQETTAKLEKLKSSPEKLRRLKQWANWGHVTIDRSDLTEFRNLGLLNHDGSFKVKDARYIVFCSIQEDAYTDEITLVSPIKETFNSPDLDTVLLTNGEVVSRQLLNKIMTFLGVRLAQQKFLSREEITDQIWSLVMLECNDNFLLQSKIILSLALQPNGNVLKIVDPSENLRESNELVENIWS